MIGHLSDCERVFGYRAMRITRGDLTVLLGSGQMSVRAILYLAAGHELHHLRLFRERYIPAIRH